MKLHYIYKDKDGKELITPHMWIDSQSDSMKAAYFDDATPEDPVSDAKRAVFDAYIDDVKAVTVTVINAETGIEIETRPAK